MRAVSNLRAHIDEIITIHTPHIHRDTHTPYHTMKMNEKSKTEFDKTVHFGINTKALRAVSVKCLRSLLFVGVVDVVDVSGFLRFHGDIDHHLYGKEQEGFRSRENPQKKH